MESTEQSFDDEVMVPFDQAFDDVTDTCDQALKATQALMSQLRQLRKASQVGNIAAVKRAQSRLADALSDLAEPVNVAVNAWPYDDDLEIEYFKDGYAAELRRVALEKGLNILERDGQLISHPSIVRVLPSERAVRIDRKKVSTIKPSHLAGLLLKAQKNPPRSRPQPFLEALYKVYRALTQETSSRPIVGTGAPVVPLARIYDLFVALPGVRRDYTATDFARDLYQLDSSGVNTTRSGAAVSFPASTGARSARNLFTFVGPDGAEVKYFGIRFIEG